MRKYLRVGLLAGLSSFAMVFTMVMPAGAVDGLGDTATGGGGVSVPAEEKIKGDLASREGEATVFVQFTGQGAFAATQSTEVKQGLSSPSDETATVQAIRGGVEQTTESVIQQSSATLLYTTSNTLRGAAITGDAAALRELAKRSDVAKISPMIPNTIPERPADRSGDGLGDSSSQGLSGSSENEGGQVPANRNTVRDTRVLDAWAQRRQTGEGMRIAVIDSGVDYTHTMFGGPGTQEAYDEAQASPEMVPGTFDPQKYLGGYDFAGDNYNGFNQAQPDNNPLDCTPPQDADDAVGGHGTHVAGTAAGYGTNADGSTFRAGQDGSPEYGGLTRDQLNAMGIGPGSAPNAGIYAFRVFGCTGRTNLVIQALDRVLDPNGDGNFEDRADIVNLSLGWQFAPVDYPQNDVINELTRSGVLSVAAAMNDGDIYDVGSTPGSARTSLSVANSVGSQVGEADTLRWSSSRGVHGSNGIVKPDVAAPGTDIISAGVGSGNRSLRLTGTSMASPHVAGIAALTKAQTRLPALAVKSIVMNTANRDVYRGGASYGPGRIGSGRVDALDATSTNTYAYATEDPELTSLSFGVIELGDQPINITKSVTVRNFGGNARDYQVRYLPATTIPGVEYLTDPSVRVTTGRSATFNVTLRINDPAALRKTIDPTMDAQQGTGPRMSRQFIAEASGRVELSGPGGATRLRVPVHAAPKPTSDVRVGQDLNFGAGNQARFSLNGRQLAQGGTGSDAYNNLVAPLELHTQNTQPQARFTGSDRSMDIQNVGVSSTIPQIREANGDLSQAEISFGISTWGNWATLLGGSLRVAIYIDRDDDDQAEYRLRTGWNVDRWGRPTLDYPLTVVEQYRDGDWVFVNSAPMNGLQGNVDSNTMDTNVMLMTIPASWIGVAGNDSDPFRYVVQTNGNSGNISSTDPVGYDPVNPGLWFQGGTPASDTSNSIFYGRTGQEWVANRAPGTSPKALFLHFQNRTGNLGINGGTGQKAEVVASRTTDDACRAAINQAATENATRLGPPAGGIVFGLKDGGCYQDFQNNASVYWSPGTGAHPVFGDIRAKWRDSTGENGPLGYPVGKEFTTKNEGKAQHFQGGIMYWNPTDKAAFSVRGQILEAYGRAGFENGALGYPRGDEFTTRDGGKAQHFQGGIIYWNPTDRAAYSVRGQMLSAYGRAGFENGTLGYPRGEEFSTRDGGKAQHFQGGIIYWNPTDRAAYSVRGEMVGAYGRYGFENGTLGYPRADENPLSNGGKSQRFQNGTLYRDPNGNTRIEK